MSNTLTFVTLIWVQKRRFGDHKVVSVRTATENKRPKNKDASATKIATCGKSAVSRNIQRSVYQVGEVYTRTWVFYVEK